MDFISSDKENLRKALKQQQDEINNYTIYKALSLFQKNGENKKIFEKIVNEKKSHYDFWVKITNKQLKAQNIIVFWYLFLAKVFGTSFTPKSLEKREAGAEEFYRELFEIYPESQNIYKQKIEHKFALIDTLHDKKLIYAGAMVLGMNDTLVELTGASSGVAFAFDKSLVVGLTGLVMGIVASLSMTGSAYLEAKENPNELIRPFTYSLYTGVSYILTTAVLMIPFFIFDSIIKSLVLMFIYTFIVIVSYNFYISVAKDLSLTRRVLQMSAITFGVTIISFLIGYLVKYYFRIDI